MDTRTVFIPEDIRNLSRQNGESAALHRNNVESASILQLEGCNILHAYHLGDQYANGHAHPEH
eukprot:CAMPEP_0116892142 /NCGR_PEP_ID=MMETSP0467-20121206/2423_1 /TAXON_ID=283647 /ORGANISM="Mesodinium pulex, Strain SPMC105" /LENGTH=62 /DNA_ID=CAMNT_0004561091 /DNA_START=575 /DNA_END=763 /DNA_ORIENTATION=-